MQPSRFRLRARYLWSGTVAFVLALLVVYCVWLTLTIRSELERAHTAGARLESALRNNDGTAAQQQLARFRIETDAARGHTRSIVWRALGHTPVFGADARAASALSSAGVEVANNALTPIVREASSGLVAQLVPHHGRVDLAAIRRLAPVVARVQSALAAADRRLSVIEPGSLTGSIREPFDQLVGQLSTAEIGVDAASRAVQVMPSMLGAAGPRHYVLLFDNNAEIRATGGIPGAFAMVTADHGRLSLGRQGSAGGFGEFPSPVLPQSQAERRIYGVQPATYFQDIDAVPDFPRTAALAKAMYQAKYGGPVDGVASIDAVSLGYLLKATGPITAPGGVRLTAANATDELLNGAYTRLHTNAEQDAFFAGVAATVFTRVSHGGGSPGVLAAALSRSASEGRLYVHSFDPATQARLAGTEIAGGVSYAHTRSPELGIYLDDATGAKMSYFLRTHAVVSSIGCSEDQQELSGYVDLSMRRPAPGTLTRYITGGGAYGITPGHQLVLVRVYGPAGGQVVAPRLGGKLIQDPDISRDDGRPVLTAAVELGPGQDIRLRWTARTGENQAGEPRVTMTPGLGSRTAIRLVPSSC